MLLNISSGMSKFLFKSSKLLLIKNNSIVNQCVQNNFLWYRIINFSRNCIDDVDEEKKKRKTERIPKITLIHTDKSVSVVSLDDAEKLAKRRNLKLIHVSNTSKSGRSVYELVTSLKINETTTNTAETHKNEQKIKSTKLFNIRQNIMNHDLNIKINNINKVLKNNYKAKIFLFHPEGLKEEVIEKIKKKIQGIISGTKMKKDYTTLVYNPLLKNENISSEKDVNDE